MVNEAYTVSPAEISTEPHDSKLSQILWAGENVLAWHKTFQKNLKQVEVGKIAKKGLVATTMLLALISYGCAAQAQTISKPAPEKTMIPMEERVEETAQAIEKQNPNKEFLTSIRPKGSISEEQINEFNKASFQLTFESNSKGTIYSATGELIKIVGLESKGILVLTSTHGYVETGFTPPELRLQGVTKKKGQTPDLRAKVIGFANNVPLDISVFILDPNSIPDKIARNAVSINEQLINFKAINELMYGSIPSASLIKNEDKTLRPLIGEILLKPKIEYYAGGVVGLTTGIVSEQSSGGFVASNGSDSTLKISAIVFGGPDSKMLEKTKRYELFAHPVNVSIVKDLIRKADNPVTTLNP